MYLLLLYLPLISSFIIILFGYKIGIKGSEKIIIFMIIFLNILYFFIFNEIFFNNLIINISLINWIIIDIGLIYDKISIIIIGLIIIIYSIVMNYSL
jgi:hypothetical protein